MAEAGLSQEKIRIIFLVFLLFGAGLLLLINPKNNNTIEKSFKTDYKHETPGIKDRKVADFYLWTKEDPLFTSPDFKSDSFYNSIVALRNEESAYFKLINRKNKLFPTDFLFSIKKIDDLEKDFLKYPTYEKGKLLINAYKNTVNYYQKDLNDLYVQINKIDTSKFKGTNIILFNSVITVDTAKKDIQKLLNNSQELSREVQIRERCLEKGTDCRRPVSDFSNFKINKSTYSFSDDSVLPKEVISPFEEFLSYGKWNGPYAVLTPCMGLSNELQAVPHLYYLIEIVRPRIYQEEPRNQPEIHAKLAETNYYVGIDQNGNEIGNEFTNYDKRRIMLESNVYDCPSSDYKATLTSINNLYNNNHNHFFEELSQQDNLDSQIKSFLQEGKNIEKAFYNAKFPSDISASNLANYYGLFYKKIIEWSEDAKLKNNKLVNDLFKKRYEYLNIYLNYKRKMGNIDEMIVQSKNNFSSFRVNWITNGSKDDGNNLSYLLYVARSMYGLTYLPFSESFYRLPEPIKYEADKKVRFITGYDKRYITYQEAIKFYPFDLVKSWAYDTSLGLEERYRLFLANHPDFKN